MSSEGFAHLHPQVQHMVLNHLRWTGLRPVQNEAIPDILAGKNTVILAPTAGGKTEAAFFPLFTRMLEEGWEGPSILYLSPIRALLNNQMDRLRNLSTILGRSAAVWHGDIPQSEKKRIRREPPDVLLTTPESLEGMLISLHTNSSTMFKNLQAVVIDEVHAFAKDDRGWHLLGVLERLSQWAGRDLQRIGLSATVGNTQEIVAWLSGRSPRPQVTIDPPKPPVSPDVTLDFVKSLSNAAQIISKLHLGEKRLVFCDSRIGAEELTRQLRLRDVRTHIVHSSLSADERRMAERAFAEEGEGVIVATSALELGIDIGDLDRVIQIDAPHSVASFLQRMGRTGRRPETRPNMLMLALEEDALIRGGAILELWKSGIVEPARAPDWPFQILAQQMLATSLEKPGLVVTEFREAAQRFSELFGGTEDDITALFRHLLSKDFLFTDGVRMGMGQAGEEGYGQKNFLELVSVFTTPPIFKIFHGRRELGEVDQSTFLDRDEGQIILLAGRSWRVESLSWKRRTAYVEPWEQPGKTKWQGLGPTMSPELAEAHRKFLIGSDAGRAHWSKRAAEYIDDIRLGYSWVEPDKTSIVSLADDTEIWTFAGGYANRYIARGLQEKGFNASANGLRIKVSKLAYSFWESTFRQIIEGHFRPSIPEKHPMLSGLKFSDLLPPSQLQRTAESRFFGRGFDELKNIRPLHHISFS